jgi:hypothetical protein
MLSQRSAGPLRRTALARIILGSYCLPDGLSVPREEKAKENHDDKEHEADARCPGG